MRVAFAIADKPAARFIETVRAEGQCKNFWFLRSDGSLDLIPMPGATEAEIALFRASREADAAVAEDSSEIGELAAAVAGRLKSRAPAELVRQIDVIIVCTTGIDSPIGVSMAGKIKHIFAAPQAFSFTIAQMDGCSVFEALRIARAFMHGPERARVVAVVSSERWWYPYFRSFGDYAQYGDGAAAMLLCGPDTVPAMDGADTGIEIVDVALERYQGQHGPFDLQSPPWYRSENWPQAVGEFIAGFLRKHVLSAADLADTRSPCLDAAFIAAVACAADVRLSPGSGGFVSSVDPMLGFDATADDDDVRGLVLSWSVGLNGEMGVCLYRRGDALQAPTRKAN